MLDGGLLAISYMGYISSQQSISGDKVSVNLSRQASHIKGVFVSFDKSSNHTETFKEWNLLYHPMKNSTPVTLEMGTISRCMLMHTYIRMYVCRNV